jgi:hypothetical protein
VCTARPGCARQLVQDCSKHAAHLTVAHNCSATAASGSSQAPRHQDKNAPSRQACSVAAYVEQGEAVILVVHPGVDQAEPQDLQLVQGGAHTHMQARTHAAASGSQHGPSQQNVAPPRAQPLNDNVTCAHTIVATHRPCMVPEQAAALRARCMRHSPLTFSTLLMTLKHTAPFSWSCQLVSSLRSR